MSTPDPTAYVDCTRYRVDRPASPEYAALLAEVRAALAADGCAVLKGFVRTARIADLVATISTLDFVVPDMDR